MNCAGIFIHAHYLADASEVLWTNITEINSASSLLPHYYPYVYRCLFLVKASENVISKCAL